MDNQLIIDGALVRKLLESQFPQWKHLEVRPIAHGGWDNRTFHLGDTMLVRMPSDAEYSPKVEKEHRWLPLLAPLLPLHIPIPLAIGQPGNGYPWKWSVYRWLEGEAAAQAQINDPVECAKSLAQFLVALQKIDPAHGPVPGSTTDRGGPLAIYDDETRQALAILKDKIDSKAATEVWEAALATSWNRPPIWVHGDISLGNLLVQNGQLSAVIDFGGLAIGDPACDLAIAWTFFKGESREAFRSILNPDEGTWARGRGWTLWKALIVAAGLCETNNIEGENCWQIINEVISDHNRKVSAIRIFQMTLKSNNSKIRVLNKLARDRLHENLATRGATAVTRILSDEEYRLALYKKLQEEVAEFLETPIPEELADVLEVVHALAPLVAGSMEELEHVRIAKKKHRGGFDKKMFVVEIHEN